MASGLGRFTRGEPAGCRLDPRPGGWQV